jgi:RNA polymerase sigma-70 factor (ECF subfamily)
VPDAGIVHEVAEEHLRSVWEEVGEELARLAGALGIGPETVGDVMQDVYLTALKRRPPEASRHDLRRWLIRVTVNRCNLEHRRKARWRAVWRRLVERTNGTTPHDTSREAVDIVGRREQHELIHRALARLEPSLRTVLVLRYFVDFSSREIADILDMADSTVRGHLRAGRKRLATELQRAGYRHD